MHKIIIQTLTIATLCSISYTADAATLSDSIRQAISTNPKIKSTIASRDASYETVHEQRAGYFPVIGVQGRAGRVKTNDDTTRGKVQGSAASWLGEGGVTITQPLFTGFSTTNRYEASEDRLKASVEAMRATGEDVALTASRAHLNLMRTRELLDISSVNMREIQKLRDSVALLVKEGAVKESELLEADEALMAAKSSRLEFAEAYDQAEADYIQIVGQKPLDKLEFGEKRWQDKIPASLEQAINIATKNNPSLLSADKMVSALKKDAKAEKGQLLPRVDAELSYNQKDQNDNLSGESKSAQAMLKMSWNFSTGGAQLARIERSNYQYSDALAKREDAERSTARTVREKYISMQTVDSQFPIYQEREKAMQKIVENYLAEYEGGKQSKLALIGAFVRLQQAQIGRTDASYRQLLSRFELLNALGHLRRVFLAQDNAKTAAK